MHSEFWKVPCICVKRWHTCLTCLVRQCQLLSDKEKKYHSNGVPAFKLGLQFSVYHIASKNWPLLSIYHFHLSNYEGSLSWQDQRYLHPSGCLRSLNLCMTLQEQYDCFCCWHPLCRNTAYNAHDIEECLNSHQWFLMPASWQAPHWCFFLCYHHLQSASCYEQWPEYLIWLNLVVDVMSFQIWCVSFPFDNVDICL